MTQPRSRVDLYAKRGLRLDAYRVVIDDWLRSDLDAPRKQRHTAKRIFDRLLDEPDGAGVVSYWMVREYVVIRLRGELVTCALFSLRLSYSGKAVHRVSASAGQEVFFEGHVHAFNVIRYDNLKAAVASVIGFSRQRVGLLVVPGPRAPDRSSGPPSPWRATGRPSAGSPARTRTNGTGSSTASAGA
ncbi:hypothetical protein [Amycolatopsis eburnea]|uniref:hypothetical protein n=1 Tax=Amycolatopsis eburnea TaxID=2267691 RepID=UPI001CDB5F31|nr:hypothetical protein [Amycolatopsis eburnea]